MTDYEEYRQKVCTHCDGYGSECDATDGNIEDCIYANHPQEDVE